MITNTSTFNRVIRKRKVVKFQDRLSTVIPVVGDSCRSSWYCPEALTKMRDNAKKVAIEAHRDVRYAAWTSLFAQNENDISCELLSMWTTNSNSLRGLERHVCASSYGRHRFNEHRQRVQAVLLAQRLQHQKNQIDENSDRRFKKEVTSALSLELATISRACSYSSRMMAMKMGKADALAVSADIMKSKKMSYIRLMTMQSGDRVFLSGQKVLPTSWMKQCTLNVFNETMFTQDVTKEHFKHLADLKSAHSRVA